MKKDTSKMASNGHGGARPNSGRKATATRDADERKVSPAEVKALKPGTPLSAPRWKNDPATVVGFSPSQLRQLQRRVGSKKKQPGDEAKHFAQFCVDYLIQSIDVWDGEAFEFYPDQVKFLEEALAFEGTGSPKWRSVLLLVARKNGKTTLLAAYALYRLLTSNGSPEILLSASSDKQADRLFKAAAAFVLQSPELSDLLRVRAFDGEIVREDGRGVIYRMSSDPKRLHGYNPSLVVCDELAQWTTPKLKGAFSALTTGGGARSAPQVFTITTAGSAHEWEDSILGGICQAAKDAEDATEEPGLRISRMHEADMLAWVYEAPTKDPHDVDAMKLANPAPWITSEYLARQAANPELSDADVLQLHGCVWAETDETWISPDVLKGLIAAKEVEAGEQIVIGFDGSYKRDATALVGCTMDGYLFTVAAWERPENAPDDWRVPRPEVHAAIDAAMAKFQVLELAADPPGWHTEIEEWEEKYGEEIVVRFDTGQRQRMCPAVDRFSSAAFEGALSYDGSHVLTRHLTNATARETPSGTVLAKPDYTRKIDAAVAAVIAYDRAQWHSHNEPPSPPRLVSLADA